MAENTASRALPTRPAFAAKDWLGLDVQSVHPQTLILAVLREAGGSLPADQINEQLQQLRPGTSIKRIIDIARRGRNLVERTPTGLNLVSPEDAPRICGQFLWGPSSAFTLMEVASHRRNAIVLILQGVPKGLTKAEMASQLSACRWIDAAISGEALREDFAFLVNAGKVRQESQRWRATANVGLGFSR
ncbi:MAG: hypothetical protein M3N54_01520 [Acidobacteriota bacterium]|nr:hypothetical protein [Acidobacteriota bacterium]